MLLGAIIYTFRDMIDPIMGQLKATSPYVILGICVMSVIYHVLEGMITATLAREYNPAFTNRMGLGNAFFCSFYRLATLGSGAGVAAVLYLGEHGVEHSKGLGLYTLQYAFHRISIVLFSFLFFIFNWKFMYGKFESYMWLIFVGYGVTFVITLFLILFCCSTRFHKILFCLLEKIDQMFNRRFEVKIASLRGHCQMMEDASRHLLRKKSMVIGIILLTMIRSSFWYAIPYLIFMGHSDISLMETLAVTSLTVMLAAVVPTPGGIGSTEFVFTMLFAGIVGSGLAGSASLLYRFGTFVFPFVVGAFIVLGRNVKAKKEARS